MSYTLYFFEADKQKWVVESGKFDQIKDLLLVCEHECCFRVALVTPDKNAQDRWVQESQRKELLIRLFKVGNLVPSLNPPS